MSDASLKRIEKGIQQLCEQQEAICARLEALEQTVAQSSGGASREEVIKLLDGFRAGEALGAASIGAWLDVCTTDCVRGALRTIQRREGMHAELLEARLRELGVTPVAEIPADQVEAAMKDLGSTQKSDAQKVKEFAERFPDPDTLLQPICDVADRLDHDQETQWLLRSIVQDERSTLTLVHEANRILNG